MIKTFEINGRNYAVVPDSSNDDCHHLVYLPTPYANPYTLEAVTILYCPACEDFYGDIDTVAEIMADYIKADANMPYPWWTLMGAIYEWGSDPILIEDEESARSFSQVLDGATSIRQIDMEDDEEVRVYKERLNLDDFDVTAIHTFVNGSHGTFSLDGEWS